MLVFSLILFISNVLLLCYLANFDGRFIGRFSFLLENPRFFLLLFITFYLKRKRMKFDSIKSVLSDVRLRIQIGNQKVYSKMAKGFEIH